MQIFLRRPSDKKVRSLIKQNHDDDVSHSQVGSTREWDSQMFSSTSNRKYVGPDLHLHSRHSIGSGERDFSKAASAVRAGVCFDLGWVSCVQQNPFEDGDTFSLLARAFGIWTASFCRVIYTLDEENSELHVVSFGFGTLPNHAAKGEERLSVQLEKTTGKVDLLIGSYSRPQSWLSRVFYFYFRYQQSKFAAQAAARIRDEVSATLDSRT
jgi:uncharacterized protein (UPF0548 family)